MTYNSETTKEKMPTMTDEELDSVDKQSPCWKGYVQRGMKEKGGRMVPNCVPATKSYDGVEKADNIQEGDFVMGNTSEGVMHGMVEHIMSEGGIYGVPGTEYAIESTMEDPAMAVRVFKEGEPGMWMATAYSIGMMYSEATKLETLEGHIMPEEGSDAGDMTMGFGKFFNRSQTFTHIFKD